MADAPNTSPAFMQTMGLIGSPISLTNQTIANPDAPGSIPVVAYDPTGSYALGNGALVEMIDIQLTNTTPATMVLMYYRLLSEANPVWRKAAMRAIASATYSTTTELPSYKMPLKDILFPTPQAIASQFSGLRINSPTRQVQWGFALTVASTYPIIVSMYGGEY